MCVRLCVYYTESACEPEYEREREREREREVRQQCRSMNIPLSPPRKMMQHSHGCVSSSFPANEGSLHNYLYNFMQVYCDVSLKVHELTRTEFT